MNKFSKFLTLLTTIFSVSFFYNNHASAIANYQLDYYDDNFILTLLKKNSHLFDSQLTNEKYEIQILYTKINRDASNIPTFKAYKYNVDNKKYFYPASSIKLPACILALEKINNLDIKGLTKDSIMKIGEEKSMSTISEHIQNILLYSDNDSYNCLYDFLGQKYFNESLWSRGYNSSKILTRLAGSGAPKDSRYSDYINFYNGINKIYSQKEQYNDEIFFNPSNLLGLKKGISYTNPNSPFDFTYKNYMSIEDLQDILKSVIFHDYISSEKRFNLTESDYEFLKKHMSGRGDGCRKYFICGGEGDVPDNIKIYNKIGDAYGYLVDNAYIVDEKSKVEFLLTAVIYTNKNNIIGDNIYEYNTIGMPFMKNLGKIFYDEALNHN